MEWSLGSLVLALLSGFAGAVCAQLLGNRHRQKMEIRRSKLEVLRKIAGNRAAVADQPIVEQRPPFFEGLNAVMVVFSDSPEVVEALERYKESKTSDRLIGLFKAICRDVGINPTAFNDSLFLEPFTKG